MSALNELTGTIAVCLLPPRWSQLKDRDGCLCLSRMLSRASLPILFEPAEGDAEHKHAGFLLMDGLRSITHSLNSSAPSSASLFPKSQILDCSFGAGNDGTNIQNNNA